MVAREDWVAGRELKQRRMVAEIEILTFKFIFAR